MVLMKDIISVNQIILQLLCMAITIIIIFSTINYSIVTKSPAIEAEPVLLTFTPKERAHINSRPTTINVGLFIRNFSEFDMVKGNFTLSGSVWFEFDPYSITLEEISNFTFLKSTIIEKSVPQTYIINGRTHARYDIKIAISSPFQYQKFPLDSHRIDIPLINRYLAADAFLFDAKNTTFQMDEQSVVQTADWQMINAFVKCGYISEKQNKYSDRAMVSYPVAYFTIEYFRKGMRNILLIILPTLLMLFMALLALSLGSEYKTSVISITTGALFAAIAYRFIIENLSPKGGYFMLSDYLYFIFLLALFIVFLFSFATDKLQFIQKQIFIIIMYIMVTLSSAFCILYV